mgnify:CR=1 FL=1|tara:strand:- start:4354 stop:4635 length:282 start_codon:yes stop_codon:yes gene_type:complete
MAIYKTTSGQTIWDLSNQLFGDSSHAIQILQENPTLGTITSAITPGTVINYTPIIGNEIQGFFSNNKTLVTTGGGNPSERRGVDLGFNLNGFK